MYGASARRLRSEDSIFDIGKIQYHELSLYNGNVVLNEEASEEEQDAAVKNWMRINV